MSMMCRISGDKCKNAKGLCVHEWMMLGIVLLVLAGIAGKYVFHWF